jgi:hypothetical protein
MKTHSVEGDTMSTSQNSEIDLALGEDDGESIVGGRKVTRKTAKSTYVPGDTGVVNPTSSGMAGPVDADGTDDEC